MPFGEAEEVERALAQVHLPVDLVGVLNDLYSGAVSHPL